jgi:O-6-methylguanine DNA methyltransferase
MNVKINKEIFLSSTSTPFGPMGIAHSNGKICTILFPEELPFEKTLDTKFKPSNIQKESQDSSGCARQMKEYFSGKRFSFDVELELFLSKFFSKVLTMVSLIPYGETRSYKDIARKVGNPLGMRAVGNANAKNPLPILIPCHRVINHDGRLGGYGGRIERKVFLLEHEKRNVATVK